MSAPSMIFRGLDQNRDWCFGQGLSSYATGSAAVLLNVQTAVQTFLGDAFWAADFGIDWLNLLGTKGTQDAIVARTRSVIAACEGVTAINSATSSLNRTTRTLSLQFNISTVYSENTSGTAQITI